MDTDNNYRPPKFEHYRPKRWQPEFDLIILDSINGLNNVECGRKYGYTPQHISNILSTEEAKEVKKRVREAIDKEMQGGIKERLGKIGEKVVGHIEKFISDEGEIKLSEKRPFEFIDRALKIGNAIGAIGDEDNGRRGNGGGGNINVDKAIFLTPEQAVGIKEGLFLGRALDDITPVDKPEEATFKVHKLAVEK